MAINIISNPNSVVSAFNQMAFNVSSTQAGQTNFNFLADVYVSGVPTIYDNLRRFSTSGSNTAVNSIFDFEDFNTNVWNGYDVSGFGFLTEIPERITIEQGQELRLSFYDPSNLIRYLWVDGIYEDLINANKVSGEFLYNVNVKNCLDYILNNTIGTHTITLANSFVTAVKTITIEIVAACSKFDTIRLHWLNNLGGWDSYNFTKQSIKAMDIERKQFKKMQSINYSKSDRLKTNYNTTITDKLQINSDWISDEMADWFQGLLTSPIVYLERGADNFIAVNITNSNYLIQQYLNARKLHNLQLDIEYSYNRYTQSQ